MSEVLVVLLLLSMMSKNFYILFLSKEWTLVVAGKISDNRFL